MHKLFFIVTIIVATSALYALDLVRESELQNECDHNNGVACLQLGTMYHLGDGVATNFRKAKELYTQSCSLGVAKGCSSLGFMYENGHAGTNYAKAAELYEKACVLGDAFACESLAVLYENGKGVSEDLQQAVNYYDRACSGGAASSCAHLALLYEQDENYVSAAIYHQNGCDAGDAKECSRIGTMYYYGQGVSQREEQAAKLFKKACELGDEIACKNYELIKKSYYIE
ncbi:tetratricopeptide repeat protein [Sulfurospirillum oryzae]|uniref:tetratricopeptide repeat protein n=1 Tax=Sulfurospirillum oryzae TaxID=2976535 RepID=UPI0021E9004E|nr:tetratricopeptide repeat protein [Sulfurospirillum oryzae]